VPAKSLAFLPYFLGVARGHYAAEGIDLEIQIMTSNLAIASMAAGELVYTGSIGSSMQASVTGQPLKVVLIMVKDLAFTLVAAPDVTAVADLRGKNAAITGITASDDYALRAILRGHGVSPDDVTAVAAQTTANSFAALSSGAVQAAMLSPPFDVQAERLGFRPLANAADYLRRAQSGLATTDRQLAERPDEVRRMIRATLHSIAYTMDEERDSAEFIAREYGIAPELARGTYEKIARVLSRDGTTAPELIREEIEDNKERVGVSADVPIAQVVDFTQLEQARCELGPR
jgi:NitT/TauT family transport system substrate-binding protein